MMKALVLVAKLAILAIVVVGVHGTFSAGLAELEKRSWTLSDVHAVWLLVAGVLYLVSLVPAGCYWHAMLRAAGQHPRLAHTLAAYFVGHLGKYVPGKAMVVVLRAGLIRGERVTTAVATVTIFFETLGSMAVGALVACLTLLIWFPAEWRLAAVAAGLACMTAAPTLPFVFRRLVGLFGVKRFDPASAEAIARIPLSRILSGWLGLAAGWLVNGLSLWATVRAIGGASDRRFDVEFAACVAAAALSTVAGFVALVPGGILVREAVVLRVLAPVVGDAPALVAAIVSRLVSVVAEAAISGILYTARAWTWPTRRTPTPPANQVS